MSENLVLFFWIFCLFGIFRDFLVIEIFTKNIVFILYFLIFFLLHFMKRFLFSLSRKIFFFFFEFLSGKFYQNCFIIAQNFVFCWWNLLESWRNFENRFFLFLKITNSDLKIFPAVFLNCQKSYFEIFDIFFTIWLIFVLKTLFWAFFRINVE